MRTTSDARSSRLGERAEHGDVQASSAPEPALKSGATKQHFREHAAERPHVPPTPRRAALTGRAAPALDIRVVRRVAEDRRAKVD